MSRRNRSGKLQFRFVLIYCPGAGVRAFLLATSAGQRARLMLPTGLLSGVELPVTSKYIASLASADNCEFLIRESLATRWNGASASLHSTPAFSGQKFASRGLPQYVILPVSRNCTSKSNVL